MAGKASWWEKRLPFAGSLRMIKDVIIQANPAYKVPFCTELVGLACWRVQRQKSS